MENNQKAYFWNMLGSLFAALSASLLLLIASRGLSVQEADTFSITYALSQQLLIIGLFQVRNFQSTDAEEKFHLDDYIATRHLTAIVMLLTLAYYLLSDQYQGYKGLVLGFIVLFRLSDVYSDVFQGYFQQQNRSDIAGKLLFIHSLTAIISFVLSLILFKSLLSASICLFLVNLLVLFGYDLLMLRNHFQIQIHKILLPTIRLKNIKQIIQQCLPLFINGFLITYIFTEPKLVIDRLLSQGELFSGAQLIFNVLFMPTFALNLLFAMLRPLITNLSYLWRDKQIKLFLKTLRQISIGLVVIGLVVVAVGYFIGVSVLGVVFGLDLQSYSFILSLLLLAGLFNVLATMLDNVMTIFRKHHYLLWVYIIIFILSKLITYQLIASLGLLGAAISFLIVMFIYFTMTYCIYLWTLYSKKGMLRRNHENLTHYSSL